MDKITDIRRRCESNSTDPEYWFKIEEDLHAFLKEATEEEKKEWFSDWGYGEIIFMMCEDFRAVQKKKEREQNK